MPDVLKAKISSPLDTALPRDRVEINPHFERNDATADPDTFAGTLASAIASWLGSAREVNVKLYLAGAPAPNFPLGEHTQNPGGALLSSTVPREVALCLSYYATDNRPRTRGRLYVPAQWAITHSASSGVGPRPTTTQQDACKDLATVLKGAGLPWVVWSTVTRTGPHVTNWYVDDEWDTQRRRGMRPTSRVTGTVP